MNATTNQTSVNATTKKITDTAVFAAMITIMTAYICHIPTANGYIHLGDTLIYLAAALLPMPYACAAAAIGGGLADLLTAPAWAPATIVIKVLICLSFTSKDVHVVNKRNITAAVIGLVITPVGYYFAELVLYGSKASAFIASVSGNLVQAGASLILFIVVGKTLDTMGFKKMI